MEKKIKTRHAKYNRFAAFDLANYILMVLLMAAIIIPFVHIISVSLSHHDYAIRNEVSLWPKGFTFDTYISVLENGNFVQAYGNTIYYTVLHTVLSLVTTAMAAYALARRKMVGRKLFSVMITITMFFGGGLIPTYMAVSAYGLVDSRWAMILPSLCTAYNIFLCKQFFTGLPTPLIESAKIEGCNQFQIFTLIILPLAKTVLAVMAINTFMSSWNNFFWPFLVTNDPAMYSSSHH